MRSTFTKVTAFLLSGALIFSANDVISFAKDRQVLREVVVADKDEEGNQDSSGGDKGGLIEKPDAPDRSGDGTGDDGTADAGAGDPDTGSDQPSTGTDTSSTETEEPSTESDVSVTELNFYNQDLSDVLRDDNDVYYCKDRIVKMNFQLEGAENKKIVVRVNEIDKDVEALDQAGCYELDINVDASGKDKKAIVINADGKVVEKFEINISIDSDFPALNQENADKKTFKKGDSIKFKPTDSTGINEVGMRIDGVAVDLTLLTDGTYEFTFNDDFFAAIGTKEKVQCQIFTIDKAGNKTESSFAIQFDMTAPTMCKNIYRVSDKSEITSETEDGKNVYYTNENCKIEIEAKDEAVEGENAGYVSGVKEVSIKLVTGSENDEFHAIQKGSDGKYTEEITFQTAGSKQGRRTYIVKVEDADGNVTLDEFDIIYDNVKPAFDMEVYCEDSSGADHMVDKHRKKYYVGNNPSVKFVISSDLSGIKDVTLKDANNTATQFTVIQEDDGTYSCDISGDDKEYQYTGAVTDKAGNTCEINIEVVVSTKEPEIEVAYYDERNNELPMSDCIYANEKVRAVIHIKDHLFFEKDRVTVGGDINLSWGTENNNKEYAECVFSDEGEHELSIMYRDIAYNENEYAGEIIIDRTKPEIQAFSRIINDEGNTSKIRISPGSYNASKKISLEIEEKCFEKNNVAIEILKKDEDKKDETTVIDIPNLEWISEGEMHTADINLDSDGLYSCIVECKDMAGNINKYSSGYFVIDTTSPEAEIEYIGTGDDKCHNKPISALIRVKEVNPDFDATVFTWAEGSERAEIKKWSYGTEKNEFLYPVEFGKEGVYDFTVTLTDKAGNTRTVSSGDPLTIDTTAPVIKVDFDTGSTHEKYYNKAITATITITEKNFDSEKVIFQWAEGSDKTSEDLKLKWNQEGDNHTAKLDFTKDGTYNFSIACADRAGNQAKQVFESGEFVIDKTKPIVKLIKHTNGSSGVDGEGNEHFQSHQKLDVSVIEHNFDPKKVEITFIDGNTGVALNKWEPGSKEDEYTCTIELNQDGCYNFKVSCMDMAGNRSNEEMSGVLYIDGTAPQINVSFEDAGAKNEKYFRHARKAVIRITEKNFDEKKVEIEPVGGTSSLPAVSGWRQSGDVHTAEIVFDKDGVYGFKVKCTDFAGNSGESAATGEFVIDLTKPTVEIEYDKDSPVNEKYHNTFRTAKVIVTDENFDEKCTMKFDITSDGDKPRIGKWAKSKSDASGSSQYTCDVFFDKDGAYSFKFSCEDMAGNKSNVGNGGSFVIDTTRPEISVTYDNNNVKNGKYYNNSRTATITIKDKAFAENLVSVESLNPSGGNGLPAISGWTASGDTHTAKISFMEDGSYGFKVKCADLADNAAKDYLGEIFVIDRSAPEIVFGGVRKNSANNGTAAPTLKCTDAHLDEAGTQIILTGTNHGQLAGIAQKSAIKDGIQLVYPDFEHTQDMDDFYTLTVKAVDLAGNETEDELNFSINRFGSTYRISTDTQKLMSGYYIGKAPTITVTEINIDELEYGEVTISKDGQTVTLKQGSDYTVAKEGEEENWKSYTYSIKSGNFAKDGVYSVGFYSKDKASNTSDNRIKGKEIEFALDTTAPSIVADGIESGMTYNEKSREVTVDAKDNMFLTGLTVTDNGETLIAMSEKELAENGGIVTFALDEADGLRDVVITATDKVNNAQKLEFLDVLITSKKEVITTIKKKKAIVETEDNIVKQIAGTGIALPSYDDEDSLLYMVVEIMSAAVLITAVVTFYRKRRKTRN